MVPRARTTARSFAIETDEPARLGGTDAAVDPMELLLAALGTCLTIGWVTQAATRGVDYRDLRIEVEGTSPMFDNVLRATPITAQLAGTVG